MDSESGPHPRYRRILIKLSGEALAAEGGFGISPSTVKRIAGEVAAVFSAGVQVAVERELRLGELLDPVGEAPLEALRAGAPQNEPMLVPHLGDDGPDLSLE